MGTLARPWNSAATSTLRSNHDATLKRFINRENEGDKKIMAVIEVSVKARDLPMAVVSTAFSLRLAGGGGQSKVREDEGEACWCVALFGFWFGGDSMVVVWWFGGGFEYWGFAD